LQGEKRIKTFSHKKERTRQSRVLSLRERDHPEMRKKLKKIFFKLDLLFAVVFIEASAGAG
jgi:hypothetical protein